MRQLATLPDEPAAQRLADYLLTLGIDTRLLEEPEGWAVWVCNEDQLPQAREEWAAFSRDPTDPRFTTAARAAQALRAHEAKLEAAYQRKQIDIRDRWAGRGGRPVVTYALIAASIVVSLVTTELRGVPSDPDRLKLFIALLIAPGVPPGLGAVLHGEVWRLVTPIFLHFGPFHLLFNMLWTFDLGRAIETRRGPARFALLVLVIAVLSNLAEYFVGGYEFGSGLTLPKPRVAFGGMSGVVYGLIGYIWMKGRFEPHLGLMLHPQTIVWALIWFFVCMMGLVGPIANVAHGVGLLAGMAIGAAPHFWRTITRPE
jgi:GlpG protein